MNTQQIIDEYIRELCKIEPDDSDYEPDLNLFDAGYLDSLGGMKLISFLEERFSIRISQKDIIMYPMNSLSEITEVVEQKLGK